MNYHRITRETWGKLGVEIAPRYRPYLWAPLQLVKAFGEPERNPHPEKNDVFGQYVFISDDDEIWAIYDQGQDHFRHGIEAKTPEQFWSEALLHYLHVDGPERGNLDSFVSWISRRAEGMPHPELEMLDENDELAITRDEVARYRSKSNSGACYSVALLYADLIGDSSVYCSVDYLKNELEHYADDEDEKDDNTERELLEVCRQLQFTNDEFVFIERYAENER